MPAYRDIDSSSPRPTCRPPGNSASLAVPFTLRRRPTMGTGFLHYLPIGADHQTSIEFPQAPSSFAKIAMVHWSTWG